MTKTLNTRDAVRAIAEGLTDVKSHGSLVAKPYGAESVGLMAPHFARLFLEDTARGVDCTVYSYSTPIAWRTTDGKWHTTTQKYSVTTSKQHGKLLGALQIAGHDVTKYED